MDEFQKRRVLHKRRMRTRHKASVPWWLIIFAGAGALASLAAAIGVGVVFAIYQNYSADYVPIEEKLRQTNIGLTEIYDRGGPDDGVLLGALTNSEADLLEPVPLEAISRWVIEATVSTEDNGFWEHPGVSITGLARAAYENYVLDEFGAGSGGSTITQQLIKNVYICPNIALLGEEDRCVTAERTLDRKLREITYAMELERDYTKEQILAWYLNQISYADRYIGIQAAAQGYFRKDAADLNLAEAALLAGIPAAPTDYHPRLNCLLEEGSDTECVVDGIGRTLVSGLAKERQEAVLDLMVVHGRATPQEVAEAKAYDLRVYAVTNPIKASAFIDDQVEPRLVRMCKAGLFSQFDPDEVDCLKAVHGAGWRVTTTLDFAETEKAISMIQEAIAAGLENDCACHNAAIVTIEPSSGELIIYAPNVNPEDPSLEGPVQGRIDQLNEINQPGSSFKPAVYLTWFDVLGKAPMSYFWDTSPLEVGGVAITNPRSGSFKSEGLISARAGLGGSQNVPAFRAAAESGPDNVITMAQKLGITTLAQQFDPTFRSHPDVTYGASIATGGANIRAVDMAYMFSVIANMGVMVGDPHFAEYVPLEDLRSTALDEGAQYDLALQQRLDFARGHIRIPGTRELDPRVILEIRDINGELVYQAPDPERQQVVDAGSVWLLHSIMSDCNARYIIWGCGGSNDDLGLDFHLDDIRVPSGVKTGTQQGPLSAVDTLETWMNGYTRYAATAVWVGNADNTLVNDGPSAGPIGYAAANATVWLFKDWMSEYHRYLRDEKGVFTVPEGFSDLQPANVTQSGLRTPITDRGHSGGCDQVVSSWVRTDVSYEDPCEKAEIDIRNGLLASDQTPAQYREEREFVKLPDLKPELAKPLVEQLLEASNGEKVIPIKPDQSSNGQPAVELVSPANGATIRRDADVIGTASPGNLKNWKLEFGEGPSPAEWEEIGAGDAPVTNSVLGRIVLGDAREDGVYTLRLTARDALLGDLVITVLVNVRQDGSGGDDDDDPFDPGGGGNPGGGGLPSHPTGFQECNGGCGTPPLRLICGPRGWFIDKNADYNNKDGWLEGVVHEGQSISAVARDICG
ncbi:MAG: penicillin-binding protein [Dehalococcoidia bacterium]|nr:penicillin-binding protein [Dehalococcoidia bacterium]